MNKKTRLIILLFCVVCFLVIAPILVLYSMGYRLDFEKMEVVATGGIYVRTFTAAEQIIIDSNISEKPGLFSNSIFVQSLLPKNHTVSIKKDGYYDYFKTLPVQESEVTKLENVLLFKKNIQFEIIADKTQSPFDKLEKFIIKNNNLYYSSSPENANISADQKLVPILKNLAAFKTINNNIIWLGTDGFLYQSDLTGQTAQIQSNATKLVLKSLKIDKNGSYKIISDSQNIFLNNNGELLLLNTKTNSLDNFYTQVKDAKISPDGKNIVYFNDKEIRISLLSKQPETKKTLLYKSSENITDFVWLNNDYIIFVSGDKIIISEIDYRGNINAITLPQKTDKIFFNQQDNKLYILTGGTLLASEKLTP